MGIKQHNLRKAAVLIASLDPPSASALLAQMSGGQAQAVRRAIDRLGHVDPDERQDVIEEFFRLSPLVPDKQPSGIELGDQLPAHLARSPEAPAAKRVEARQSDGFLHEAAPHALARFLEREHPQTIAVVVSHLTADRAAEVLSLLHGELQVDVARRLVDLDETDPEVVREIERGLQLSLGNGTADRPRRKAGLTALGNILEAADPRLKRHLMSRLGPQSRPAPTRPAVEALPSFTFADLERLDTASLTVVLHHAQPELLVLALAGAPAAFARRVFELFPADEAAALDDALAHLGPTRLSDVAEAQHELAELASQLEQRGEISPDQRARNQLSVAV
jgi:flagellar motor switch protein FliG